MLSIGEFAFHGGVSVRMLRHYDALGLLTPAEVDPHSGYRRYRPAQLTRLNRLLTLKDLGFTLEQIGPVLDAEVSAGELRAMRCCAGPSSRSSWPRTPTGSATSSAACE